MKNYFLALALAFATPAVMAEGEIFDPWDTPTIQFTCTYPIEREDGTMLMLTEIGAVDFYVSDPADGNNWVQKATNIVACEGFVDISNLADGQYYATATVTDTDSRQSVYATTPGVTIGAYAFEISSYTKPPKGLTGMTGVGIPRTGL